MKKFTPKNILLAGFSFLALTFQAQNLATKVAELPKGIQLTSSAAKVLVMEPEGLKQLPQAKTALMNCTDKIDYSGNTIGPYAAIGSNTNTSNPWELGLFQVYPAYPGEVIGVEFTAAKFSGVTNPKVYAAIFDLSGNAPDVFSQYPTSAPFVTINNTSSSVWSLTFASPISVSGGFAVGLFVLGQDSAKIYTGPVLPNVAPYYSYVYTSQGNMYTFSNLYGVDANILAKPIVTTSVNPTWLTARTSTGCGIPAVYNFTNTTTAPPAYATHTVINPSGITRSLDFGDGSPVVTNFPTSSSAVTHSYTTLGTFTADYTQTYVGWTSNCVESKTILVTVDNPLPSFTYNTSGLTVMFTNTSQNLSTYSWNFGDLSTSTQTDPTHTFSSPGTYVVELEGTAPCGKVRYSTSVVVAAGTGIKEQSALSSMISVFPNPASTTLYISNKSQDGLNAKIEVFNSVGASVKVVNASDLNSGSTSLDVSDLSKGIYFIKFKSKQGDIVKSFVKE